MSAEVIAQKLDSFLGDYYTIKIMEENEKPNWYSADIVIITNCCPMVYDKKLGWTQCGKCLLNYECGHGSLQFKKFCDDNKIKYEWFCSGQVGIYLQKPKYVLGDYEFQCSKCIPCFESGKECCRGCGLDFAVYNQPEPVRTPIILYHKGKPQRAVLVE